MYSNSIIVNAQRLCLIKHFYLHNKTTVNYAICVY